MMKEMAESLKEILDVYWGEGDGDPPPKFVERAIALCERSLSPEISIVDEVIKERRRQIEDEGFTTLHDDKYDHGELARAGASYAVHSGFTWFDPYVRISNQKKAPSFWPWPSKWWKPKDPRRDLIKAAALIVAEIERLDRSASNRGEK